MKKLNFEMLTGRTEDHLVSLTLNDFSIKVHDTVVDDLRQWEKQCQLKGIDFAVASAFRSYERQLLIWNEKIEGKRVLKNADGQSMDVGSLKDEEILSLLLLWNHIPGVSRHHWGTDLDIFDASWYKKNQQKLELENHYFEHQGPCAQLHRFNEYLLNDASRSFPFYRPYNDDHSFMPELWHYSHRLTSEHFQAAYTFQIFVKNLEESRELLLRDLILVDAQYYYQKFVTLS